LLIYIPKIHKIRPVRLSSTAFRNIKRLVSPRETRTPKHCSAVQFVHDAQTDIPAGYPAGAICIQRFDDSLHSAIHNANLFIFVFNYHDMVDYGIMIKPFPIEK